MKITGINGTTKLANGVDMPYFGLGAFLLNEGKEVIDSVKHALKLGYRHIDTASLYANEKGVGEAIKQSGIDRKEIFVTTKVWNSDQGYESTLKAFDKSMSKLGFDYLDLYLVHWPVKGKFNDTWRALEKIYRENHVRAIGVSNFLKHHLEDLLKTAEIIPMVNQMEFHPYLIQQDLIDYCHARQIQYEAWSPLMQGKILNDKIINVIANKYGKTSAQIILRWDLQKEVITIPKSAAKDRILSNSLIFDFELSQEDVDAINKLDRTKRIGADPDNFSF